MQNEEIENTNPSNNVNNETTEQNNPGNNVENTCKAVVAFMNIFEIAKCYCQNQQIQQQQQQIGQEIIEEQNDQTIGETSVLNRKSNVTIQIEPNTIQQQKIQKEMDRKTFQPNYSICSVGSAVCRICQIPENEDRLISPCLCKGSLAYVHKHCLERWLSISGMVTCELCHYQFKTKQKLRYTFCQSIRLWYRHPNNLGLLQADFLVCSLLSIVSVGLIGIAMLGLHYFSSQGDRLGVSRIWSQFIILVFLCIIIAVYIVNVFVIIKSQIVPWYRWWRSTKIISLILENHKQPFSNLKSRWKNRQQDVVETELRSTVLSMNSSMLIDVPTAVSSPLSIV